MGNKYNLVLEALPGDFMPIDINLLVNNKYPLNFSKLENIDAWSKKYTMDEIINKIKDTNIVEEKYLRGNLSIINERKYRFPVMTKDDIFQLDTFLYSKINDKQLMNKVINIYQKYEKKNVDELKQAIKDQDAALALNIILSLPYEKIRNIYYYLYYLY